MYLNEPVVILVVVVVVSGREWEGWPMELLVMELVERGTVWVSLCSWRSG